MATDRPQRTSQVSIRSEVTASTALSVRIPNPDVFSDDYAVDGSPDISPVDSIQNSSENLTFPISQPRTSFITPPSLYTHLSRPTSTSKRPAQDGPSPHRAVSAISRVESTAQRTSSTSSRFSVPRAQGPYVGPSRPSHPYAMYPQITRASSVASESNIRPIERQLVLPTGPEQAYSMYPQNTVPEDDALVPISLGFPGMGQVYETRAARHDVADIVGADGHVEELPPYSRYAQNVVPKAAAPIGAPGAVDVPISPVSQYRDGVVELQSGTSSESERLNEKRGWKRKVQRRVCAGLPLWALVVLVVIAVVAACMGGIVGGVVGQDRGVDAAADSASVSTVYLDATSVATYTPAPSSVPEGPYIVPINQGPGQAESSACIANSNYSLAWSCMDGGSIGINIDWTAGEGPSTPEVRFNDYSKLPANFHFGPQAPNLTTRPYTLAPYMGRNPEDSNRGVALFFWTTYTKVAILPREVFGSHARLQSPAQIQTDEELLRHRTAEIGQQVWLCKFEDSMLEFFLWPNDTSAAYAAVTNVASSSVPTSSCVGSSSVTPSSYSNNPAQTSNYVQPSEEASTTQPLYTGQTPWPTSVQPPGWSGGQRKRQYYAIDEYRPSAVYPRSIKIVEKRKPAPNPSPYCAIMEVQPDWSLQPVEGVDTIYIPENDFSPPPATPSSARIRLRRDTLADMQSNCACEYTNS